MRVPTLKREVMRVPYLARNGDHAHRGRREQRRRHRQPRLALVQRAQHLGAARVVLAVKHAVGPGIRQANIARLVSCDSLLGDLLLG